MPVKGKIYTFEEHGEVLNFWFEKNFSRETLLFFDQHLDLKHIPDSLVENTISKLKKGYALDKLNRDIPFREDISISAYSYGLDNFLYMAGEMGLLDRVIWVLPEKSPLTLTEIARKLLQIVSLIPNIGENTFSTFRISENSVTVQIGNIFLEVTTLRRVKDIKDVKDARIDIDLDYFFNAFGEKLEDVDKFIETLSSLDLLDRIETLTYSISSGFLPPSHRWIANHLAAKLDKKLIPLSRPIHTAQKSLQALSRNETLTLELYKTFVQDELYAIKGPGDCLRSLLALQVPDLKESRDCYYKANENGDRASIAAYSLGQYYYKLKDFQEAIKWFDKAQSNHTDTVHMHSLGLKILSLARLNKWEEVLHESGQAINLIPCNDMLYKLNAMAANSLNLPEAYTKIKKAQRNTPSYRCKL